MKITENVIMIDCTKGSYAYAIVDEGVTLIDTSLPGKGEAILAELKTYGIEPKDIKTILLTHHDIDHIGNVEYLANKCNCEVLISEVDLPYALGNEKRHGIKKVLGLFMKVNIPASLLKPFHDKFINNIEIIPTVGHTPGHTSFKYKNVLLAGDLISSKNGKIVSPPSIMMWNKEKSANTCKSLDIEGINWICSAHGLPVENAKDAWKQYLNTL